MEECRAWQVWWGGVGWKSAGSGRLGGVVECRA